VPRKVSEGSAQNEGEKIPTPARGMSREVKSGWRGGMEGYRKNAGMGLHKQWASGDFSKRDSLNRWGGGFKKVDSYVWVREERRSS